MRALKRALRGELAPEIVAYADGSGTTKDKAAGIGVYITAEGMEPLFIADNIGPGTNNRAELSAVWRALQEAPDMYTRILVRTDSEYTIGSLTGDWSAEANAELIKAIRNDLYWREATLSPLISTIPARVTFEHVRGHAGIDGNEVADLLSKAGRKHVSL